MRVYAWFQIVIYIVFIILCFLAIAALNLLAAAADSWAEDSGTEITDSGKTAKQEVNKELIPLYIAVALLLIGFIGACCFVCCDSVKSRRIFCFSTFCGAISTVIWNQNGAYIGQAILGLYWSFEIYRLSAAADEMEKNPPATAVAPVQVQMVPVAGAMVVPAQPVAQ